MDQQPDLTQGVSLALQQLVKQRQQQEQQYSPQSAIQGAMQQVTPWDSRQPQEVTGNHDYAGLCQAYAEMQTYGHSEIYKSASDAWDSYQKAGMANEGLKGVQPGDLVYFAPDNSNAQSGHVGIYQGNGLMQSATYQGVRTDSINKWTQATGQKIQGFVNPQGGKK